VVVTPEVMRGLYTKYSLHDDVFPYHGGLPLCFKMLTRYMAERIGCTN